VERPRVWKATCRRLTPVVVPTTCTPRCVDFADELTVVLRSVVAASSGNDASGTHDRAAVEGMAAQARHVSSDFFVKVVVGAHAAVSAAAGFVRLHHLWTERNDAEEEDF
jgi:hypothetical protein